MCNTWHNIHNTWWVVGGQLFFSEEVDDEEHNEMVDNHFRSDYWELLAPTLTSLTLEFQGSAEISQERLQPLLFLHNLQSLELTGGNHFIAYTYGSWSVARRRKCASSTGFPLWRRDWRNVHPSARAIEPASPQETESL